MSFPRTLPLFENRKPGSAARLSVRSLWLRLVFLTLLPLILLASWNIYTRYNSTQQQVLDSRLQTAELWGRTVTLTLGSVASSAGMAVQAVDSGAPAGEVLQALLEEHPSLAGVQVFGSDGRTVTMGHLRTAPPVADLERESGGNLDDTPLEVGRWLWTVSDPVLDQEGNGYFWMLVHPRSGEGGRIILAVNVQRLLEPLLRQIQVPAGVNLNVINSHEEGFFSAFGLIPAGRREWGGQRLVDDAVLRRHAAVGYFESVQEPGIYKLGAGVPVAGTPWAAATTEPVAGAMGSARNAVRLWITALALTLLLTLALAGVADGYVGRRLQGIILGILTLGQGELSHRVPVGQIEALADVECAFNDTAQQLEDRTRENRRLLQEASQRAAELRRTSGVLKAILDNDPTGLLSLRGSDHRVEYANPTHLRNFAGAQVGATVGNWLAGEARRDERWDQIRADLEHVAQHGEPRRRDGVEVPGFPDRFWNYVLVPLPADAGEEAGVLGVYHEVTEVMSARRLAELRRLELQAVVDSIPDPITVVRPDGTVALANPAARAVYSLDEFPSLLDPDWREHLRVTRGNGEPYGPGEAVVPRTLRGESVRDELQRTEDSHGEHYWLVTATPFVDDRGRVERALLVTKEVTTLKQLEQAKDVFLSIASHELKTPLTAMGGYIDLVIRSLQKLRTDHSLSDSQAVAQVETGLAKAVDRLRASREAMKRMASLLDDLLDVSRLQMGRFTLHPRPIDLAALLKDMVERWRTTSDRHALVLEAPSSIQLLGDAIRLEQVFSNLLSNSIKYSPGGGEVRVEARLVGDAVRVTVTDQGQGIQPENLRHLFNPFYREHFDTTTPGLGLGLFITKQIIERHGGGIEVNSRPGHGSTFIVTLPAATPDATDSSSTDTGSLGTDSPQ